LTNAANQWAKKRRKVVLKQRPKKGKCEVKGCTRQGAVMAHVRETPLCRTGPRGRKERLAEYSRYPKHFKLVCKGHAKTDKQVKNHDRLQCRKGKRKLKK
jgi:hypothetical protein